MVCETLKNRKLIVDIFNPEPELKIKVQDMLDKGVDKESIECLLKRNLCRFEWKIKHIISGVMI